MKKLLLPAILATFMLTASSGTAHSAVEPDPKSAEYVHAKVLMDRLYEIKAMDKSELSLKEKRAVRKEIRTINKELKALGGGVYISAGAVLLILILLIIFL